MGNMATEIVAFILTISGWILVSSTLPTDYWKVSSVDGTVITTATFWSNLWKTCVTDSTGVSNCKDFPSMLALDGEFTIMTDVVCCMMLSSWGHKQRYIYLSECFWGTMQLWISIWVKHWCSKSGALVVFGWMTTIVNKRICNLIFPFLTLASGHKQPPHLKLKANRGIFQQRRWPGLIQPPNVTEWSNLRKSYSPTEVTCHFPLLSSSNKERCCLCNSWHFEMFKDFSWFIYCLFLVIKDTFKLLYTPVLFLQGFKAMVPNLRVGPMRNVRGHQMITENIYYLPFELYQIGVSTKIS